MTFRMKDTDLEAELKSLFADIDADGDGVIGGKDADKVRPGHAAPLPPRAAAEAGKLLVPTWLSGPHSQPPTPLDPTRTAGRLQRKRDDGGGGARGAEGDGPIRIRSRAFRRLCRDHDDLRRQ